MLTRSRARRLAADERGAVVPLVAVSLVLIVALAAFAVDLGMQRVVRRDMQAVSDTVSLDVVRTLKSRRAEVVVPDPAFRSAVVGSVDRNAASALGDPPLVRVEIGTVDTAGAFTSAGSISYRAQSGVVSGAAVSAPATRVTAVRVTSDGSVSFAFVDGSGGASRSAVAVSDTAACFSVGSYAARIATGDSFILGPLLGVLGTGANLTLLDAQGLAGLGVSALDLIGTNLTAGGFEQLVGTTITLRQFYLAVADVLQANGADLADVALLNRLAGLSLPNVGFRLGDVIDLGTGTDAALGAALNVFDLVTAAAFVANGTNAVAVPGLTLNLPGLAAPTVRLTVAQRPVVVCGRPAEAGGSSSQVSLSVATNIADVDLPGLLQISAPLTITLDLAPSTVGLTSVRCTSGARVLSFTGSSGLLDLDVRVGDPGGADDLDVRTLLGIPLVSGHLALSAGRPAGASQSGTVQVSGEDYDGAAPFELGSGSVGLPALQLSSSNLTVLGILPVGGILGAIVTPLLSLIVNPLLQALDTVLLSPLLEALGINLAGADVRARPAADCGYPKLVG